MDELLVPPENPASGMGPAALGLARYLAPNMTSLVSGEAAPPPAPMAEQPGKTPSARDPREIGALVEGTQAGLGALTIAAPGGAAKAGGQALESAISQVGSRAAEPGLGALLGMAGMATEAQAKDKVELSPAQLQKRELERQRREDAKKSADEAAARAQQAKKDETEALLKMKSADTEQERLRLENEAKVKRESAESAAKLAGEQQEKQAELERQYAQEMADRTFREKFPKLSLAAEGAGVLVSSFFPFMKTVRQAAKQGSLLQDWERAIVGAEDALAAKDLDKARLYINQLSAFKKQEAAGANPSTMQKVQNAVKGKPADAITAFAPAEFATAPELTDQIIGTPKAKEKSRETILDPVRLGAGAMLGTITSTLGTKAGKMVGHNREAPVARSEAAMKTYKEMMTQQATAKGVATKQAKAAAQASVEQAKKNGRIVTPINGNPMQ